MPIYKCHGYGKLFHQSPTFPHRHWIYLERWLLVPVPWTGRFHFTGSEDSSLIDSRDQTSLPTNTDPCQSQDKPKNSPFRIWICVLSQEGTSSNALLSSLRPLMSHFQKALPRVWESEVKVQCFTPLSVLMLFTEQTPLQRDLCVLVFYCASSKAALW